MKLETKQIVEILGLSAVVASLLFVGMQLRLDRNVAMAQVYADRAEAYNDNLRSYLESESWLDWQDYNWELGIRPSWWHDSSKTAELLKNSAINVRQINVGLLVAFLQLTNHDNIYYQYKMGLLDEELWLSQCFLIKGIISQDNIAGEVYRSTGRL